MFVIYHSICLLFLIVSCLIVSVTSTKEGSSSHHSITRERVFVAMKPDAIQRSLVGEIIQRFEKKGLRLVAIKLIQPDKNTVKEQYHDLINAPFFQDIMTFFCSGPVCASVWEGENAVLLSRKLIGKTHPEDAEPGSIRGDYCCGKGRNLVHASDSVDSAIKEINIWFKPNEILNYKKTIESWLHRE